MGETRKKGFRMPAVIWHRVFDCPSVGSYGLLSLCTVTSAGMRAVVMVLTESNPYHGLWAARVRIVTQEAVWNPGPPAPVLTRCLSGPAVPCQ